MAKYNSKEKQEIAQIAGAVAAGLAAEWFTSSVDDDAGRDYTDADREALAQSAVAIAEKIYARVREL